MEINAYVLLAVLAAVLLAMLVLGLRFILGGRKPAPRAPRSAKASEYYAGTLRQAAEVVGGEANLAAALKVPPEALRRWLEREESPPIEVHLAALELVTRGTPHARAE